MLMVQNCSVKEVYDSETFAVAASEAPNTLYFPIFILDGFCESCNVRGFVRAVFCLAKDIS